MVGKSEVIKPPSQRILGCGSKKCSSISGCRRTNEFFSLPIAPRQCTEESGENFRNLENGAIILRGDIFAKLCEPRRLQHLLHSARDIIEALQHNADVFL